MLIHSGLTQEFYLNRLDLDNHAESVLKFNFGVFSLLRISFDFVVKNLELFDKTVLQGKLLQNFFRCSLMVHRKIKVIMAGELGVGVVMWQRSNPAEVYIFF